MMLGVGHIIAVNLASRRYEYSVLGSIGAASLFLGRLIPGKTVVITIVARALGIFLGAQFALVDHTFLARLHRGLCAVQWSPDVILLSAAVAMTFVYTTAVPVQWHITATSPSSLLAAGRRR